MTILIIIIKTTHTRTHGISVGIDYNCGSQTVLRNGLPSAPFVTPQQIVCFLK